MTITPYTHSLHFDSMSAWYQARGLSRVSPHLLPETGYVVGDCVAGFIFKTDASLYLIEAFISDPFTHPTVRDEAIAILIEALLSHVPPGSKVMALSNHSKMKARATAQGFAPSTITLLEKDT